MDKRLAEAIIAEIWVDMTRFGQAGRLASWAGMCPWRHESAGKSRSGRSRHGDTHLRKHLAVAAMAAARTKDTSPQYARLVGRRGKPRAREAVGRSILAAAFHMLAGGVPTTSSAATTTSTATVPNAGPASTSTTSEPSAGPSPRAPTA
ncbi:MAG: transposase [Actinomycetota bacterium]|nr:transposase [Actinomycetota bacterium]